MGKAIDFIVDRGVFGRIKSLFQWVNIGIVICFGVGDFATKPMDSLSMALVIGCGVIFTSNRHFFASLAGGKSGMVAGPHIEISFQAFYVLFWLFTLAHSFVVDWCLVGRIDAEEEDKMVGIWQNTGRIESHFLWR
jgi:hypothetical protein